MIHPDLICIFNSIKPEEKSEDPDTLKKNILIEVCYHAIYDHYSVIGNL